MVGLRWCDMKRCGKQYTMAVTFARIPGSFKKIVEGNEHLLADGSILIEHFPKNINYFTVTAELRKNTNVNVALRMDCELSGDGVLSIRVPDIPDATGGVAESIYTAAVYNTKLIESGAFRAGPSGA